MVEGRDVVFFVVVQFVVWWWRDEILQMDLVANCGCMK